MGNLVMAAMLLMGAYATAEDNYIVAGSAYNLANGELVYRELYTNIDENRQVRVHYLTPGGDRFASKTLTYNGALFQPEFDFTDIRDNEQISAKFDGPRLILNYRKGKVNNSKTLFDNARVVIDAGFDAYIQLNWDQLVAGKRLRFDLAYPIRMTTIALEVRVVKGTDSPAYDKDYGKDWIYFRIAPARAFASLFADPIYIAYDPNGRYLMRYHGRSNLDDYDGNPWDVRIEYEYAQ